MGCPHIRSEYFGEEKILAHAENRTMAIAHLILWSRVSKTYNKNFQIQVVNMYGNYCSIVFLKGYNANIEQMQGLHTGNA
jgi:hypothetical protein